MTVPWINLIAVWVGIVGGMASGAVIGMAFHKEQWQGGYDSWRRRLMRLGHISFFGLAFVNLAFVQAVSHVDDPTGPLITLAGYALILAHIAMPTVCFLAAWRKPFRNLFFIPVSGALVGSFTTLFILIRSSP